MSIFQTIKELRHNGRPVDAWNIGFPELQKEPNNLYLKRSLFWACYDGIKTIQEQINHRKTKAPSLQEQQNIESWISRIGHLNLVIPCEELDFRFYNLFKKNGEHYESFIRFTLDHFTDLFRSPEDYTPFQGEKFESPSLIVKQARVAAKGWLMHRKEWSIDFAALISFLDMANQRAMDNDKTWLHYDYAKCLISAKRYDDARDLVLPIVRKKASEFWAWGALAATFTQEDPLKAEACYCRGLCEAKDEKFSVKMRGGLAFLLAQLGKFSEASALVCSIADTYRAEGWTLKPEYEQLMAEPWFDASKAETVQLDKYFHRTGEQANQLLYEDIETTTGVVHSLHRSGKGFNVYLSPNNKIPVRKGLFTQKKLPEVGTWASVTYGKVDGKAEVLTSEPAEPISLSGIETETGLLRINPAGFGFVGDVFVSPDLVNADWEGVNVEVLKAWDINPKKKQMAWRALTVNAKL